MGLSIHYSGTLQSPALIPALVEEVQDVCTIMEWPCQLIDIDDITGIHFTPPESETLALTFFPNGQLVCLIRLKYEVDPATDIAVKTQYAGVAVHQTLIKLFKHLKARYFATFNMVDESSYWETGDEALMHRKFKQMDFLVNTVRASLAGF